MTTAEVEGVEKIECNAKGLIAARVIEHKPLTERANLKHVLLDLGGGKTIETVSAAPVLHDGVCVVYAPSGSHVEKLGTIRDTEIAGHPSLGMILPGDAIGIDMAADTAIFLPPATKPGDELDPALFEDWVIEIDNKSITHRPDLWGHYGIAREVAAMLKTELRPYPLCAPEEINDPSLPEIPIEIDDPELCRRYSGLRFTGVQPQHAPLWMQLRLGHVGLRPIDCLVDLTNYIMLELGQPMHAFDGDKVERIEVGLARSGSTFVTLDGVERKLPDTALMILNQRYPIALAGIMGGLETEISIGTDSLLLESANFEPATIRRCATALGLRTDACVRFEKSLDPENTVLSIRRFVELAKPLFPEMRFSSRLSDCYPKPAEPITVDVDPTFVAQFMGHPIERDEMIEILEPLGFEVDDTGSLLSVKVPSWRATKDIAIEADIIEEIARYVGYDNIESVLPEVEIRSFDPNPQHEIEQESFKILCDGLGFHEIHGYIWYDGNWVKKIGFESGKCIRLRNPAASGMENLRQTLMPGMLAATEKNRHHCPDFKLVEIGGVFDPKTDDEHRRLGLVLARRQKKGEDRAVSELKGLIETWSSQVLYRPVSFDVGKAEPGCPWEHPQKTADILIHGLLAGKLSVVPLELRRKIDEHLSPWVIAWAEIDLGPLAELPPVETRLVGIPAHPEVELDFSFMVDVTSRYADLAEKIGDFDHDLLKRISYVSAYEGKPIPDGKRSITVRCRIGDANRTLTEEDITSFVQKFEEFLIDRGWELRK